jgi:hypothetical protein
LPSISVSSIDVPLWLIEEIKRLQGLQQIFSIWTIDTDRLALATVTVQLQLQVVRVRGEAGRSVCCSDQNREPKRESGPQSRESRAGQLWIERGTPARERESTADQATVHGFTTQGRSLKYTPLRLKPRFAMEDRAGICFNMCRPSVSMRQLRSFEDTLRDRESSDRPITSLLARKFSQVKVVLNYNDLARSMGNMSVEFPGFPDLEALYWYVHVTV